MIYDDKAGIYDRVNVKVAYEKRRDLVLLDYWIKAKINGMIIIYWNAIIFTTRKYLIASD